MDGLISVIIPSRNEPYLFQTVNDLLTKASNIEVIIVLDGYWPEPKEIINDKRVTYIHFSQARGMRNALNSAVSISKGEFILKSDAHCMFDQGFDTKLKADIEKNWIVIPRRYPLDVEKWEIEKRSDDKYPIDVMVLSDELQAIPTKEKHDNAIINTESFQGSCWFMYKDYYNKLGLMDEEKYGTFWQEAQEMGLKCKQDGGRVVRNTKTWYAHWHKTKGRGYSLQDNKDKTREAIKELNVAK